MDKFTKDASSHSTIGNFVPGNSYDMHVFFDLGGNHALIMLGYIFYVLECCIALIQLKTTW